MQVRHKMRRCEIIFVNGNGLIMCKYNEQMHDTTLQKYEYAHSKQCTVRLILTCCYDILKTYIYRFGTTFTFLKENA